MSARADGPIRLSRLCTLVPERHAGRTTIKLKGDFDLACEGSFREQLGWLLDQDTTKLVVDLRGLDFLDSTGLRMLISLHTVAESDGFELAVWCNPTGRVRWLLEQTGLDAVLPLVEPVAA